MDALHISSAEADDIMAHDKAVDQGKRTEYDLDPATEKMAKKMANVTTKTVYNFTKRERKANPTKAGIIAELAKFLAENSENACENVTIPNKERMIAFDIGEDSYEVTLIKKNKSLAERKKAKND